MKLHSIAIKNFRSFKDCTIDLSDYTSLVGSNGAGKSTILCSLNIFFRENESSSTDINDLDVEDFHARDTSEPIEITLTFSDLSAEAQQDFSEYYRQNHLVVTARASFDLVSGVATVRQFGQRRAMKEFSRFFELYNSGKPAAELKEEFQNLRKEFSEVQVATSKDAMRDSLRSFEENHPERCVLIPSEDQFYGFSKGANRLSKYIQWVYVPAVKDATKENVEANNTALGKILARTVRAKVKFDEQVKALQDETLKKYKQLLESQQGALDEISESLTARLMHWAHPQARARVAWTEDPKKSVQVEQPTARLFAGEGEFEGELARSGHGLQRSYLLALLQELVSSADSSAPTLLLGCEEPELYQHPPQARHLANVLELLSKGNAQVIVSTHSPYFVSGRHFECVRVVRRDSATQQSSVSAITFDVLADKIAEVTGDKPNKPPAQAAKLHQALQPHLNEMFFSPKIVLVEGLEDAAYITACLILTERWDQFRKSGVHIVPANGKSYLVEPAIIAQALGIPIFVIFDADGNIDNKDAKAKHEKDNKSLLKLLGGDPETAFPSETVWSNRFVQWQNNLGQSLKSEVGQKDWDETFGGATKRLGDPEGSYAKNPIHIGDHVELLHQRDKLPASLVRLCTEILRFGNEA